ncbi:MAG TPA: SRPBCC family protein [Cytophagales bacterium]|nr:SRPBCC family protein [Cytophagales bacterium]
MPTLTLTTPIKAPIEICFDLSRSIDLHQLSTAHTKEKAIAGVTKGLIEMGEQVTWRAKHLGVFQTLTSKITAYDFPIYFQDTMQKGAFKSMVHDHCFRQEGELTIMEDILKYESPLWTLGKLADFLFLKNYLYNLIEIRNKMIKGVAENGEWKKILQLNF